MGIGASIFLVAIGAILAFAVTTEVSGVDISTVGWILMIVGALSALLSLIFWSDALRPGVRRREYVEGEPAYRRRRRVVEEDDVPPPGP